MKLIDRIKLCIYRARHERRKRAQEKEVYERIKRAIFDTLIDESCPHYRYFYKELLEPYKKVCDDLGIVYEIEELGNRQYRIIIPKQII